MILCSYDIYIYIRLIGKSILYHCVCGSNLYIYILHIYFCLKVWQTYNYLCFVIDTYMDILHLKTYDLFVWVRRYQ